MSNLCTDSPVSSHPETGIFIITSQQSQNFCITFVKRRSDVFDAGTTLYKCYTNLFLLSKHVGAAIKTNMICSPVTEISTTYSMFDNKSFFLYFSSLRLLLILLVLHSTYIFLAISSFYSSFFSLIILLLRFPVIYSFYSFIFPDSSSCFSSFFFYSLSLTFCLYPPLFCFLRLILTQSSPFLLSSSFVSSPCFCFSFYSFLSSFSPSFESSSALLQNCVLL